MEIWLLPLILDILLLLLNLLAAIIKDHLHHIVPNNVTFIAILRQVAFRIV
jgi:hypothetical protein